ncbi:hypothetical protein KC19_VG263700 [Ceratodon purpureus]|uniref:Uncharacterized protein n=1 Tax=Ceratodon purpureus TaxID=3225 RepID=A0A8T0HUP0_CERPU|nr:hypothetical protein KC19_VG263700 [Ceratodon purpureus]
MSIMVFWFGTFMNAVGECDLHQVWLFALFGSIQRAVPEFDHIVQKFEGKWVFSFRESGCLLSEKARLALERACVLELRGALY